MGLFDTFKRKSNAPAEAAASAPKVDLEKKISLAKEEVQKICLTKKPLNGLTAHVGLVLDYSGSMSRLYADGTVQRLIEKILPLAMQFDDNGSMEVWLFDNSCKRLPDITLSNLEGYIARETARFEMGGTEYAPAISDVTETYKGEKMPSYVLFVTDGDNSDHRKTDAAIIDASYSPIFWQFVGVGSSRFDYLQALDDMTGRNVDNADFFKVGVIDEITYSDLLNEFPEWLEYDKVKAMLRDKDRTISR